MKLKEIDIDRGLDVVAEILQPIGEIALDEKATELFRKEKPRPGETVMQAAIRRLCGGLPALIKKHKENLILILAALDLTTPEEYRTRPAMTLVKDLVNLTNDEDIDALFTSAETDGDAESSGSASENTMDEASGG